MLGVKRDARSGAVFEAPTVVPRFEDVAMVRQSIEQCGCHLGIAENVPPFAEAEIGGDDDAGAFIKLAEQMEQQRAPDELNGR